MALTDKQARFVQEYLIDLNATQAAIRAGYAAKDADVQGPRLLGNVGVREAIDKAQRKREKRTEITQDMVLHELAKIGFADMRKLLKWTGNATRMNVEDAEETGDVQISYANLVTLFDSDELPDDIVGAISEISQTKEGALKIKLHDKQAALVNIGKHLGMFKERVEHTGKDGGPIEIDQVKNDADAFTSAIAGIVARVGASSATGQTEH